MYVMYINRLSFIFFTRTQSTFILHCTLVEVEAGSRVKKMKVMGHDPSN